MAGNSTETVLIVESDVVVRHPLAEYLRDCGFRVLEASDEDEARTALGDPTLNISVVIVDTQSAGGGFALARWIRQRKPGVDVILAGTVEASVEKAADLCKEGPALSKPFDHRIVLDRIRQMIAARLRGQ